MVKEVDIKKPLDKKILSDHNNNFVKTLLYIYSMESFLFKEINRATREKDLTKLSSMDPSPLHSVSSFIVVTVA